MSNGKNPLMLMMALTMPGAAHSLGLGDIHVDSALNEHLAAEIDIVGASALELNDLRAAVANRETFLRYGVDRPAFLSSAVFKVAQDAQGRPVLAIRSTESFTEPVVNFLVDLHWSKGELVRQYTLLLDPADFAARNRAPESLRAADGASDPATPDVPAAPPVATPIVETKTQTSALQSDPPKEESDSPAADRSARTMTHVKVGAKATLRGIAWRVGERSEPDLQRMMLAIFRANPGAFDGNINRLHLGALLTIPSESELAAISRAEAKREIHAQMAAWHPAVRAMASMHGAAAAAAATSAASTPASAADTTENEALARKIQSLEHELSESKVVLDSKRAQIDALAEQAARNEKAAPAAPIVQAAAPAIAKAAAPASSKPATKAGVPVVAGLGLLAAALAGLYFRFRRRTTAPLGAATNSATATGAIGAGKVTEAPAPAAPAVISRAPASTPAPSWLSSPAPVPATATAAQFEDFDALARTYEESPTDIHTLLESDIGDATQSLKPAISAGTVAARGETAAGTGSSGASSDTTVALRVDSAALRTDPTRLDYNLLDLDQTALHVHMPSALNENVAVKERRTNLTDVLKSAIEREPDRDDLRMKLLEMYYAAASTNRQGFLDVVQKFARERDKLDSEQWEKIAFMGRQIAAENPLFAEADADGDLADCA